MTFPAALLKSYFETGDRPTQGQFGEFIDACATTDTTLTALQAIVAAINLQNTPHVRDYGAVGDGTTDDSAAWQAGIDDVKANGGGVLRADGGQWLLKSTITIKTSVIIYGDAAMPVRGSANSTGSAPYGNIGSIGSTSSRPKSMIICDANYNSPGTPQFNFESAAIGQRGMIGFYICEPKQVNTGSSLVACGPVFDISNLATGFFKDLMFNNSYIWFSTSTSGGGGSIWDNIYGTPLYRGWVVPASADVAHISNVHFWTFWTKGAANSTLETTMETTSVGFEIANIDAWQFVNIFGYHLGTLFLCNGSGSSSVWAQFTNILADKAVYAFDFVNATLVQIKNLTFTGRDAPYPLAPTTANRANKPAWEAGIRIRSGMNAKTMIQVDGYIGYSNHIGILVECDRTLGTYSFEGITRKINYAATTVAGLYSPDDQTGPLVVSTAEANITCTIMDRQPFNCFYGSNITVNGVKFPAKGTEITPTNLSARASWSANGGATAIANGFALDMKVGTITYASQTVNFTVGQMITGATSGAVGTILADADAGNTGTLTLGSVVGTFVNGETITDPMGGTALTSGTFTTVTQSITFSLATGEVSGECGPFYLEMELEHVLGASAQISSNTSFVFIVNDTTYSGRSFEHANNQFYPNWYTKTKLTCPIMLRPNQVHNFEMRWGRLSTGSSTFNVTNVKMYRMQREDFTRNADGTFNTFPFDLNATVAAIYDSTFYKDPTKQGIPIYYQGSLKRLLGTGAPNSTGGSWWLGDLVENRAPAAGAYRRWLCTSAGTYYTLVGAPTGDTTNGSTSITNVSDTSELKIGTFISCGTIVRSRIVEITGTTVVAADKASATAATNAITVPAPVFTNMDFFSYTGTFTWDPGSLADGVGETWTGTTVTGAAFGDIVSIAAPYDLQGILLTSYVSAANTIKARLQNETTGTIDLASGSYTYRVSRN